MAADSNVITLVLVVVGGAALFGLLRRIDRRLNVFTRGTVGFMAFALVTFTAISVFVMLHDVKLEEQHARAVARRRAVQGAVLGWMNGGEDAVSAEFRSTFAEDLSDIEMDVARGIREETGKECSFGDLELIALDVDRRPRIDRFRSALKWQAHHHWNYEAVFRDGASGELHRVRGKIYSTDPHEGGFVITGVDGGLVERGSNHDRYCMAAIRRAAVYRSPTFDHEALESRVAGRSSARKAW